MNITYHKVGNSFRRDIILKNTSAGFTLVELSVVLIIIGVLVAGFFSYLTTWQTQKNIDEINEKTSFIQKTLTNYIKDIPDQPDTSPPNNFAHTRWNPSNALANDAVHYPCPAPLTAASGDANFGVESRNNATGRCDASVAGVFQVIGTAGQRVFIGAVPVATLGISSDYMEDAYGNKITYAVSDAPSRSLAFRTGSPVGAITINDNADPSTPSVITNANFVFLSHGRDQKGAYTHQSGVRTSNCTGSEKDQENCDFNDATFNVELISEGKNNDYFDDTILFNLAGSTNTFGLPNCAAGETILSDGAGSWVCGIPTPPDDGPEEGDSRILPCSAQSTDPTIRGTILQVYSNGSWTNAMESCHYVGGN